MSTRQAASSILTVSSFRRAVALIAACVLAALSLAAGSAALAANTAYATPLSTQALTAAPSWTLSSTNVTIKDYTSPYKVYLNNYDDDEDYAWASSNATNIVSISDNVEWDSNAGKYYIGLQKKGVGKAIVTVYDYYTDTSRKINVDCVPFDFGLDTGDFTFQKSTPYNDYLYVYAKSQYDNNESYYDSYINSAISSNARIASVEVHKNTYDGKTYSYAIVTPHKTGSANITYTDQLGRNLTYVVTIKSDYWKANLKARTYGSIGYGEKKVYAYSKPGAKVTLKIGGEKHTKKANKYGQVTFKLKNVYKVGKKFTVSAKLGKLSAKYKGKVYKTGYTYFRGRIWSNERYMPIRVSNAHKGDYLVLSCGKEKHKKKFKKKTSSWSGTLYMKNHIRHYNYRTIYVTLYNKFGQKLSSDSWYIHF